VGRGQIGNQERLNLEPGNERCHWRVDMRTLCVRNICNDAVKDKVRLVCRLKLKAVYLSCQIWSRIFCRENIRICPIEPELRKHRTFNSATSCPHWVFCSRNTNGRNYQRSVCKFPTGEAQSQRVSNFDPFSIPFRGGNILDTKRQPRINESHQPEEKEEEEEGQEVGQSEGGCCRCHSREDKGS
jgi:hypothetical protein